MITEQGLNLDPDERQLCADCVGEIFLAAKIEKSGNDAMCSYCGNDIKSFSVAQMADLMETLFEQHFDLTEEYPSGYELAMMNEYGWERHGDPVVDVIEGYAEINRSAAEDIQSELASRHYDYELAKMGEEGPFDEDAHYEEKGVDDYESRAGWTRFEESLTLEGRYFNRTAEDILRSTFENLVEHKTADGLPVIVSAGPGTNLEVVYRARVFQSDEKLEEALKWPDREIGPPPALAAFGGRMNAHGIAVFYGATDPSIALAEVRPPVGAKVLVGRFRIRRSVRLLDIEGLQSVYAKGSLFDPDYLRRLKRAKFLRWLSGQITQPVMPDDERFGYLATQAMADFLATHADPPLDGIIYPTVQGSDGKANVVLFHKASRVEKLQIADKAQISVSLSWSTEEEEEEKPNYMVWEEVNHEANESAVTIPFQAFPASPVYPPEEYDQRESTLRLDVSSLKVHHIASVQFKTASYDVTRHLIERESKKPDETTLEEPLEF